MSEVSNFVSYSGNRTSPFVIGHRGAAGHAPENTLSSFSLAIEMGADAVEFDIHQTADNRIVVIHDEALDRTTDGEGAGSVSRIRDKIAYFAHLIALLFSRFRHGS